jgi:hypothetical protein
MSTEEKMRPQLSTVYSIRTGIPQEEISFYWLYTIYVDCGRSTDKSFLPRKAA